MKIIITETQSAFLKRRLEAIDEFVKIAMKRVSPKDYSYHDYLEEITWQVLDEYEGKIGREQMDEIYEYVKETYWKKVENFYLDNFLPKFSKP